MFDYVGWEGGEEIGSKINTVKVKLQLQMTVLIFKWLTILITVHSMRGGKKGPINFENWFQKYIFSK